MDRENSKIYLEQIEDVNSDEFIKETNVKGITRQEVVDLLNTYGVIKKGHFILLSGLHSPNFIQFNLLAQTMKLSSVLASEFTEDRIDIVFTPETSGISLSAGIADLLKVNLLPAPIDADAYPKDHDPRYFTSLKDKRVLIVVDIITSANGLVRLKNIIEKYGGTVVGIAAFINRGYVSIDRIKTLSKVDKIQVICTGNFIHYEAAECELCKKGIKSVVLAKHLNFSLSSSVISKFETTVAA